MLEFSRLTAVNDESRRGISYSAQGTNSFVDISLVKFFGPLFKRSVINEAATSLGLTYDEILAKLENGEVVDWVPIKSR